MTILRDLCGINVDVDHGRAGRKRIETTGDTIVETGTEGNDQIRTLQGPHSCNRPMHARHAEVVTIRVGERSTSGQGRHDGRISGLNEGSECLSRAASDDTTADVQHGRLCFHDRSSCSPNLLHVRAISDLVAGQVKGGGPGEVHLRDLGGLGDVHEHGTGTSRSS